MAVPRFPGGEMATRPLHFIWICDCSGSMGADGKIQALNTAIREAIPHMKEVASQNPNAEVLVRAVKFSSGATWHVPTPTNIDDFRWTDLAADGLTEMGKALTIVAEQLKTSVMGQRALPPVLVLISDGEPTDDFNAGLQQLLNEPWGRRAVRVAISIGGESMNPDAQDILQRFIGHAEMKPLQANNPEALVKLIRWVSTVVVKSASSPNSQAPGAAAPAVNVQIPEPPPVDDPGVPDVW